MSVPNQIPESNYVGNGTTTTFAANFDYASDSDVFVTVNGVTPEIGQATFANGVFTFTTAPASGAAVRVYRSTPVERDTEYDNHDNVFRPKVVNIDFDRIWFVLQEYLLSLGITNARITQEIADRIQADAEMMNYILNEDNELKADYILRDENLKIDYIYRNANLKKYVDQTLGALSNLPDFQGIEAKFVKDSSGMSQQEINDLTATPFQHGAIGDGKSHKLSERFSSLEEAKKVYPHAININDEIDWCAIQSLNKFVIDRDNLGIRMDWSGKFCVNRTISYITPASQTGSHRTISGDTTIVIRDDFEGDDLFVIHGRGVQHKGVIRANLNNKIKFGIQLAARGEEGAADYISFGNSVGKLFINNAICTAVRFTGSAMFGDVEFLRAEGCGVSSNYAGKKLEASVISHTQNDPGKLTSNSVMAVDVIPTIGVADSTILVKYGNFVSNVTAIDSETKTITVKPLLPVSDDSSLKLQYIYGGAIQTRGSDSAGGSIQKLTNIGCGIGVDHKGMYPLLINQYLSEYSGVALYSGGLVSGLDIKERYIEGDHFVLVQNSSRSSDGITNLDWGLGIDPSKIVDISFGRNSNGTTISTFAGVRGLKLWNNNLQYVWRYGKLPNNVIPNGVSNGFGVDFNTPYEHKIYKATGNLTVGFMSIDENYNRLFGLDSQAFTVFGRGLNGAPTGTITIPVLTGYTLNGGTDNLTYSGFNAAAHFKFFLNVAEKDIQVSVSGVNSYNLSVGEQLANGSNANDIAVNTNFWFRAATTATNLPTPTTGTKVDGNITTVFSVANTGTSYNKTQTVEYVSLFEKWSRIYSSSSGSYGAWKLTSYEIKKGTTAQRPANPQIGMRYYDTTLLPTGKPIEWNGTSWVDATGAIV